LHFYSQPACLTIGSQSEKIIAITNAAGIELESIWATLLAKALEGKNVKELLSNVGSGGGAPAVGAPAAGGGAAAAAAEAPAEEKKEEEKEESDDDMVRMHSICYYACQVLTYAYVIGLWSLRLIYCSHLHRLLAFPTAMYFPLALHAPTIIILLRASADAPKYAQVVPELPRALDEIVCAGGPSRGAQLLTRSFELTV
jgi:large subunit ribosomal protein LP1